MATDLSHGFEELAEQRIVSIRGLLPGRLERRLAHPIAKYADPSCIPRLFQIAPVIEMDVGPYVFY